MPWAAGWGASGKGEDLIPWVLTDRIQGPLTDPSADKLEGSNTTVFILGSARKSTKLSRGNWKWWGGSWVL